MSDTEKFDFKKCWLDMSPAERDQFAAEAGTTSHYIRTHLTGRRKTPGKALMSRLFKASKARHWVKTLPEFAVFFYS